MLSCNGTSFPDTRSSDRGTKYTYLKNSREKTLQAMRYVEYETKIIFNSRVLQETPIHLLGSF